MEFEDVGQKIEFECMRVAAAFVVEKWDLQKPPPLWYEYAYEGLNEVRAVPVRWYLDMTSTHRVFVETVEVGKASGYSLFYQNEEEKEREAWPFALAFDEVMVRGLYCLGIEDEKVLAELPQLSAHEKLELRLSMPHEFWPQKWLDEEKSDLIRRSND